MYIFLSFRQSHHPHLIRLILVCSHLYPLCHQSKSFSQQIKILKFFNASFVYDILVHKTVIHLGALMRNQQNKIGIHVFVFIFIGVEE